MGRAGVGRAQRLDDGRLTTVGLLFESAAALRGVFERQLEAEQSLSAQSFDVLVRLARSPGNRLRMSELAAQATLTPSGLTRSVDRLRRQGLVERRACPEDRRGAFAELTPAGRTLMDRALPEHARHVDEVLDELFSTEEERLLSSLLRRLRDSLYEAAGGLDDGPARSRERVERVVEPGDVDGPVHEGR